MTRYEIGSTGANSTNVSAWPNQYDSTAYHTNYHWYPCSCHTRIVTEKISLTMEEIDRLRAAALISQNIKEILNKLAKLIDVEVTFS